MNGPPVYQSEDASAARSGWAVWLLIVFFFLVTLGVSAGYGRYNSDEWYYTDGALRMLATGEYLVPTHAASGGEFPAQLLVKNSAPESAYCFTKPPFTAWLVAASYKIFGVSIWSGRLLFILIGCVILWLTYQLAWLLFQHEEIAVLSVAIMASSHKLIILSGCSITDVLFALGLLASHFGFMRLLFPGRAGFQPANNKDRQDACAPRGAYAWAYLGAGLAVATRGLLGVTPVFFAYFFAWWRRKQDGFPLRRLSNLPMLAAGAVLGLGWIVPVFFTERRPFLETLFLDQAGHRFHDSLWYQNVWYYPLSILTEFVPWEIPLVVLFFMARAGLAAGFKRYSALFQYFLGWSLLVVCMYVTGNLSRVRYLLPCFPFFSMFLAAWLVTAAKPAWLEKSWKIMGWVAVSVSLLGGLALAGWGKELHESVGEGGVILCVAAVAGGILLRRALLPASIFLAAFAILFLAVFDVYGRAWSFSFPEPQIAQALSAAAPGCAEAVIFSPAARSEGPHKIAARLRVCTAGRVDFPVMDAARLKERSPAVVIFEQHNMPELDLRDYQVSKAAAAIADLDAKELFTAWRQGRSWLYLAGHTSIWCVAKKADFGL